MEFHPASGIFPLMAGVEFDELVADIAERGQREAVVLWRDGRLLDGRNRWRACEQLGVEPRTRVEETDDPVGYVISLNLKRRHLTPSQAAACAVAALGEYERAAAERRAATLKRGQEKPEPDKQLFAERGQARDFAAEAFGTNRQYVSDAKALKEKAPEIFEAVRRGERTIHSAKKEVKAQEDRLALAEAQASITEARRRELASVCDLRVCSCSELFESGIRPDVVITDPPYPREYLSTFTELATSCAMAKVPLVAVMSGQTYLPEVLQRLCEHLEYRWTLAYMTPGGQSAQSWTAKVNTFWKPVLLFGAATEWIGDVASSDVNDNDKRYHGWGQSESGIADLVNRLSNPGQLVCDPFLGGGTTAVISLALGRRFVGCDIDPEHVRLVTMRVEASG